MGLWEGYSPHDVKRQHAYRHARARAPSPPSDADFAIYIDFEKGRGSPTRVFRAADLMIRALQNLDKTLCGAIDSHIEPIMLLEDLETGSIKAWLKNALQSTDDQALKDLDWKPAVGKYLARAKYAYIRWANKDGGSIVDLAREIKGIAEETDVKHIPDYAPPSLQDLADSALEIDKAKAQLEPLDRIQYITDKGESIEFDLAIRWSPEELSELSVRETTKFESMPLNLIVKKPDYLGTSKWEFRHGKKSISAKIDDGDWLSRFQGREIDVRPGDALRCLVTIENSYGFDNELIKETYSITKVEDVLPNQYKPADLFGGDW